MTWLEATLADLEHFSARCIFFGQHQRGRVMCVFRHLCCA